MNFLYCELVVFPAYYLWYVMFANFPSDLVGSENLAEEGVANGYRLSNCDFMACASEGLGMSES